VLTRKDIIDTLKKDYAYAGDGSLESVKAFIADAAIELVGDDGRPIDLDAAWSAKRAVQIAAPSPAPQDRGSEATPSDADAGADRDRKSASLSDGAASRMRSAMDAGPKPRDIAARSWDNIAARKRYDRLAAQGRTRFADADTAEYVGAHLRVAVYATKGLQYSRLADDLEITGKAQMTSVHTLGGYAVPSVVADQVIDLAEQFGVAQRMAEVIRLGANQLLIPRFTSEITFSYAQEDATFTAQDPSGDQVALNPTKSGARVDVTYDLFEDSIINQADALGERFARGAAIRIDRDYFLGDGGSSFGGKVGLISASVVPSVNASGTSWSAVTIADIVSLIGSVSDVVNANLAFAMSRQAFAQIALRLASAQARNASRDGIFADFGAPDSVPGADAMINGFPVYFSQVMPVATAATTRFAYFGDFRSGSKIGIRREMTVRVADATPVGFDGVTMLATMRTAQSIHGSGKTGVGPIAALTTT
jgi:HK97 family phage major capsid protein